MFEQQAVREAPAALTQIENDSTRPAAANEPVLAVDNIQGNIIGFNKDHQTMLFLKITDAENFRRWLRDFVPFIATAHEVLTFNRLFKAIRRRRGVETHTVQATWINIAFSFDALEQLSKDGNALQKAAQKFTDYKDKAKKSKDFKAGSFSDEAFKKGMAKRAVDVLGDPQSEKAEGNPRNWVFGGTKNEADVVVIVASDSDEDLDDEVGRIEESIYAGRSIIGEHALSGVQIVYKQNGATLPPPLTGHEHFGFLDGVSQPGLRGRISDDPTDVLTPRQNPKDPDQGKPGQDLLWTGEFIFGYPKQFGAADPAEPDELNTAPGPIAEAGPVWAKDGSFLVVRRLRQEVGNFHKFLEKIGQEKGLSADLLGAKLVGRWKSGAPIMRQPTADNPALGNDDCANNHFEFNEDGEVIPKSEAAPEQCSDDVFPIAKADEKGLTCPFAGHIRKTYPRDDKGTLAAEIGENTTQTHRLLRRGIPFGNPFFPPDDPNKQKDSGNRGLLFAAYQTSIVNQFEFVQAVWSNNAEFKDKSAGGKLQSGHDFIIGQNNAGGDKRTRRFILPIDKNGTTELIEIKTENDWVIPTGGGYFFQPSIDALCLLSGRNPSR